MPSLDFEANQLDMVFDWYNTDLHAYYDMIMQSLQSDFACMTRCSPNQKYYLEPEVCVCTLSVVLFY